MAAAPGKSTQGADRYHHGDLRAALLVAAESELTEKGIEAFSLRGVAKRAGVSHAAPAHHFSDMRGLLTALADVGFRRFVECQKRQMAKAAPDPAPQLAAAGLGYMKFAAENPALFRLIFSSGRTDYEDPSLGQSASEAFGMLVTMVSRVNGRNAFVHPEAMLDVTAVWAVAHGIADLLVSGRLKWLASLPPDERDKAIVEIIGRVIRK
jgi:AcrR family transcriptional regulator